MRQLDPVDGGGVADVVDADGVADASGVTDDDDDADVIGAIAGGGFSVQAATRIVSSTSRDPRMV